MPLKPKEKKANKPKPRKQTTQQRQNQTNQAPGVTTVWDWLARQQQPGFDMNRGIDQANAGVQKQLETALKPQNKIPTALADQEGANTGLGDPATTGLNGFYANNPDMRPGEFDPFGSQAGDPRSHSGMRRAVRYATGDAGAQNELRQQGIVAGALENYANNMPIFGGGQQDSRPTRGQQFPFPDQLPEPSVFDPSGSPMINRPSPQRASNEAFWDQQFSTIEPPDNMPSIFTPGLSPEAINDIRNVRGYGEPAPAAPTNSNNEGVGPQVDYLRPNRPQMGSNPFPELGGAGNRDFYYNPPAPVNEFQNQLAQGSPWGPNGQLSPRQAGVQDEMVDIGLPFDPSSLPVPMNFDPPFLGPGFAPHQQPQFQPDLTGIGSGGFDSYFINNPDFVPGQPYVDQRGGLVGNTRRGSGHYTNLMNYLLFGEDY
jgi:hypothetical protein